MHRLTALRAAMALLLCGIAVPTAITAQSTWRQVAAKLLAADMYMSEKYGNDVRHSFDPFIGSLENNTYKDVTYTFQRDMRYLLLGVADDNCGSLDLRVYDNRGQLVPSDSTSDRGMVIVTFTPRRTGTFNVRVTMSCQDPGGCEFGIAEYH